MTVVIEGFALDEPQVLDSWSDPSLASVLTESEVAFAAELDRLFPLDRDAVHPGCVGEHGSDPAPLELDEQLAELSIRVPGPDGAALRSAAERGGCASAGDLALLEAIDPATLDDPVDQLAYVRLLDRLEGALHARRYDAVLSVVPVLAHDYDYVREAAFEIELAALRRTSIRAAGSLIARARAARRFFPEMLAALAAGEISDRHLAVLVERTRVIEDEQTLIAIAEQALPLARQLTPPRFTDALEHVIIRFDPDAPGRRRRARTQRDVWTSRMPDGMAMLGITNDAATIAAMRERIQGVADELHAARGGAAAVRSGDTEAAMNACRADAAAAIVLGTRAEDGSIVFDPEQVQVHVDLVIDLQTLRGELDNPVLLHGCPIPAEMGREIAGYARAFRRIVTDPVTGVALDVGSKEYLPRRLREYVLHRDGGCRIPGCSTRRLKDLEMDHALAFPLGPSSAANTGALSAAPCHKVKTAGLIDLVDGRPDGSVTLVTMLGQRVFIPPRPYIGWQPPQPDPPDSDQPDVPPF